MTRVIVTAVPQRSTLLPYLQTHIPHLEVVWDQKRNAMDTFLRGCLEAGNDPVLRIEDDILLTRRFLEKTEEVIKNHPDDVIQFFSMRRKDLTIGSRWEPGSTFMMNQCYYLPSGVSRQIYDYYWSADWQTKYAKDAPTGYDILMARLFQQQRRRYWLHVPSLVEHLITPSVINPKRPMRRQSLTFTDPEYQMFPNPPTGN